MPWLNQTSAARYLDVHPATIRKMEKRGELRAYRSPSGLKRYLKDDIDAMMRGDDDVPTGAPLSFEQVRDRVRARAENGGME
jgi:excisionase family DNA binding protein